MSIAFKGVKPVLRMFSVEKAREFYCDWLGFKIDWEHRFDDSAPLFMQVSRDNLVLFLSEHHGDSTPGSKVYVEMTGVADLHRELTAKNYGYMRPGLDMTEWKTLEINVIDPFGNRIVFAERTGTA
jgi:catechol 2,3-dioxygenase-like lactoylglutathione lyase family enzyme